MTQESMLTAGLISSREGPTAGQPILAIELYGNPAPQGSKRAFRNPHSGRIQQVESSKAVKPWREAVKAAVRDALPGGWLRLDGPLLVEMVFTFDRPRSHYRTGRNAHLLRDAAPVRPAGQPDLSKLCRSTEDALTDVGIWRDDAQVVEYGRLAKVYADEGLDALPMPGAVIRVWEVTQ